MKKLLLFPIIFISMLSCSKPNITESINQPISENGSIQYKVNGELAVIDNVNYMGAQYVLCAKQIRGLILPKTRYLLNAQKGVNNLFIFPIVTDSLQQKHYHSDSTTGGGLVTLTLFNGNESAIVFSADYLDVNIASYKNSRISGTFTGRFTPLSSSTFGVPGSIFITEGIINNVQVIY